MNKQTVTIKGQVYDIHTGKPLDTTPAHKPEAPHYSQSVHQSTQKSKTLNRRTVTKTVAGVTPRQTPRFNSDVVRPKSISKFAPHPSGAKEVVAKEDAAHIPHPAAVRAQQKVKNIKTVQTQAARPAAPKPAGVIKKEAIDASLAAAPSHTLSSNQLKSPRRLPRIMSVTSVSLALLLLAGYFTYINMPSLSVRVAAAQAGVNASYPSYHPDGYSLNGPVAYSQGEVNMKFASTTGPQNFTIAQSKSNWDSTALLQDYVKQHAGDNYITYDDHGLTIYTYESNAAWVNDGILYTITGDAPLSSDQIRQIAASM